MWPYYRQKTAAAAICEAPEPRVQAPWFWSTQGKNKMQMVGIKGMATQWVIRQDHTADVPTATALGFNDDNQLMAAQCLNNPKRFCRQPQILGHRACTRDIQALADASLSLKEAFSA